MISLIKQNSLKLALYESMNCLHSSGLSSDLRPCNRSLILLQSHTLCTEKHFFSEAWYAANENVCTFIGLAAAYFTVSM